MLWLKIFFGFKKFQTSLIFILIPFSQIMDEYCTKEKKN